MKILLVLAVALAGLVAGAWFLGSRLPAQHRARMQARVGAAPDAVYALITDVGNTPAWRKDVKSVELLDAGGGLPGFRENGKHGAITYRIEAAEAPHRFVTRIADTDLGYGGSWTWDIRADGAGSLVTITEDGEVTSPLFRLLSRYVFGHHSSIDSYLQALVGRLGGSAPQRLPD
ncbi:SRPBCC family protein [Dokdonella sp.]|uniref:SRPBCC family protein n=1 Tax=Dokdonella sp. TaxID=2291710 RepID=UPI001B266B49|nr:SRPBCC family protein [Dokdonella sp.]MBO9662328.1 SRPBCC family protein [Dokdonella sp.]